MVFLENLKGTGTSGLRILIFSFFTDRLVPTLCRTVLNFSRGGNLNSDLNETFWLIKLGNSCKCFLTFSENRAGVPLHKAAFSNFLVFCDDLKKLWIRIRANFLTSVFCQFWKIGQGFPCTKQVSTIFSEFSAISSTQENSGNSCLNFLWFVDPELSDPSKNQQLWRTFSGLFLCSTFAKNSCILVPV